MAGYSQRSRGYRFIWSQKSSYFGNVKFLEDHFEIEGINDFRKKFLEEFLEEQRDIELIMVKAIDPMPSKEVLKFLWDLICLKLSSL